MVMNGDKCAQCHSGLYLSKHKLGCLTCGVGCLGCNQFGECIECSNGFLKSTELNACVPCAENCEKCADMKSCEKCKSRYYLEHGFCKKCSDNCQACTSNIKCTECMKSYELTTDEKTQAEYWQIPKRTLVGWIEFFGIVIGLAIIGFLAQEFVKSCIYRR